MSPGALRVHKWKRCWDGSAWQAASLRVRAWRDVRIPAQIPAADVTLERRVACLPDLAHATLAEGGQNLVMTEPGAELHGTPDQILLCTAQHLVKHMSLATAAVSEA